MEKAKLMVRETKRKKIIAELEFENGRKMTVRGWTPEDTTLDGTDIEVEREEGQVVLVKVGDEILFSRNISTPDSSPSRSAGTRGSSTGQSRVTRIPERPVEPVQQNKERQHEHVRSVRHPAYAPYNFVPLNRQIVEINPTIPPLNKYDPQRNTGWIEIEIEAKTPLYIRGTLTKEEVTKQSNRKDKNKDEHNPDFFAPAKQKRIPGSSLRGMTRSMMEIVSFGKFSFFDNKRLYYRGLADQSNLRQEYQQRMNSYDRQARKNQYSFSAGVLRKSEKMEKGLHFEILSSGDNFRQIFKDEARRKVQVHDRKYEPFNFYELDDGYLVVSGDIPKKRRDWLISYPSADAEVISIRDEDIQSYNEDRTRSKDVPNLVERARKGKEVPCFYVLWKDGNGNNRVSFGHTGFFRLAYEKTIGEHVPAPLKAPDKIDFADAIFGNEKTHAGRVFFEDAFLIDGQDDPQLGAQTPQILSAPKPTTFQHYLVQTDDEVRQLNHYNSETEIRGYKLYWHKSGERWIETDEGAIEKNPKQYTKINPVKAGTRFRGKIRFENLSDKELGALLFALDLPQGCGHKLGMGKPLGLGSIRITPTLHLSDRKDRYRNLFAEWDNDLVESDRLQEKKREFEKYVLGKLGEDEEKQLWEIDRLLELLVMLRFDVGTELERTGKGHYMTIEPRNEFKTRDILPMPTALVSPPKIAQITTELISPRVKIGALTAISFENYKAFPSRESIEVRPLTILIGRNSSGKSVIARLPLLIARALSDWPESSLELEFDGLDFGASFVDCIHKHIPHGAISVSASFTAKNGRTTTFWAKVQHFDEYPLQFITHFELTHQDKSKMTLSWIGKDPVKEAKTYRIEETGQEVQVTFRGLLPSSIESADKNYGRRRTVDELVLEALRKSLEDITYLGPFRQTPTRSYRSPSRRVQNVGIDGANAPHLLGSDVLHQKSQVLSAVGEWFKNHLGGWSLDLSREDEDSFTLVLRSPDDPSLEVNFVDVGTGISQVLPIVVQRQFRGITEESGSFEVRGIAEGERGSLEIIEQPELHLHPGAHGDLADLYVEAVKQSGRRFIVETHSENFLLRVRRRIAEGKLDPKEVAIYWIDNEQGISRVQRINIDKEGEVDTWPTGVFSEDFEEVKAIRRAQREGR